MNIYYRSSIYTEHSNKEESFTNKIRLRIKKDELNLKTSVINWRTKHNTRTTL